MEAFGFPPGFHPGAVPQEQQQQPLSSAEVARRLLIQHSPFEVIDKFRQASPAQRNIGALYALYTQWMAANAYELIQAMADGCLLGHYSDSLLLTGGWQNNRECLEILWRDHVDFGSNWPGDKQPVLAFMAPLPEVKIDEIPPTEKFSSMSTDETD